MNRPARKSIIVLWLLAPLLLLLSSVRPPNPRNDRARNMPDVIGEYTVVKKQKIRADIANLLGTRDVAWRIYRDALGNRYYMTIVFHDSNWKSLHPPHICIRGSNFSINSDLTVDGNMPDGRKIWLGRLLATEKKRRHRDYVSLYAFVGQDFVTPSYMRFFLEHAPRALFRRATSGFLLRVEAFVGKDGQLATEKRCWKMFQAFLPAGEALIKPAP